MNTPIILCEDFGATVKDGFLYLSFSSGGNEQVYALSAPRAKALYETLREEWVKVPGDSQSE